MGYLNNVTGYRDDLLANRAIVKHGNYALRDPLIISPKRNHV
ncbi:Allantoin catabolism protein [Salmonella enterica subsp. enterica serovar Typhi]|nr:Allantoin catabolism protein [Salmonella enterica subsp. enterica serovar Typhi]CHX08812.1 Allantoin catabolism protein [Salmonella enterica subsp. enterica serovar Typhi]